MKTNIVYLFAGLLAVTLLSCSEDSEPLIMQEEVSTPMLDYQTLADAQRALRPSATAQELEQGQPDKKGEKGRDHRDWFDAFENTRIKSFENDITQLDVGDLYAIDPDGVNPYIFKFYFPEEYRDYAKKYEGMQVNVGIYSKYYPEYNPIEYIFQTLYFSLDDSFTVSRYRWDNPYAGYYIKYTFRFGNSIDKEKETTFKDLVIIKEWH